MEPCFVDSPPMNPEEISNGSDSSPSDSWDAITTDPKSRPKLDAFLRESATEADEPLDISGGALARLEKGHHLGGQPLARDQTHAR